MAQKRHLSFEHITIENGMSSNHINSFVRDKKGYLWIGSTNGLNRYDGYTVKTFVQEPNDTNSIIGNSISSIVEDDEGNIWAGSEACLNKYVPSEDKFYHYITGNDTALGMGATKVLIDQKTGLFWLANNKNNAFIFNPKTTEYSIFKHDPNDPNSIGSKGTMGCCQDEYGNIWLSTWDHGISKYNRAKNNFTHYLHNPKDTSSIFAGPAFSIAADKSGNLWVGTLMAKEDGSIARLDIKTGKFKRFTSKKNNAPPQVFNICTDLNGNIWFATINNGLSQYDVSRNTFSHFKHSSNETESLNENFVLIPYIDDENNLWAGTINKGINKTDLKLNNIYYYPLPVNESERENMRVNDLCEDDKKNIWISNSSGLFKMEPVSGKFSRAQFKMKKHEILYIEHILNGHDGTIWAITTPQIYRININTMEVQRYANKFLHPYFVSHIFKDKRGNTYVVIRKDLLVFPGGDLEKKPTKLFEIQTKQDIPRCEFIEEGDSIWLRADQDYLKINSRTFAVKNVISDIQPHIAGLGYINGVHKAKNNVFIHLLRGVVKYNLDSATYKKIPFRYIGNDEVTPCSFNFGPDDICFSSFRGVFLANIKTMQYSNPKIFNHDKFNSDYMLKSSSGLFYLAAGDGFISFDPYQLKNLERPKPRIIIEDFYLFNKNVRLGTKDSPLSVSITDTKEITLNHKQSVFSFEITLLTLDEVDKNTYSYILEGFEKNWSYIGPRKVATYTSLPAGEYIFKYRGKDKNGTLSDVGLLKITILPPYWETWWFRLLVASAIAGVIYLLFMLRIRAINRQKIELEHQVLLRTAEILSQKEEIMAQKEAIEFHEQKISELYKDVTDSIQAAQRIQEGILPPNDLLKDKMTDSFILYQPKDIVSGDFYWFYTEKDLYYIAAIDCTGHGVAGAFMSLIAYNLLNLIVKEDRGLTPDKLLEKLNRYIINVLHQESENSISKDGMDASVCMIDIKKNQLHFAGANNALYLIRNGVIEITKADSNSVGIQPNNKVSHFTNHVFDIQAGDCFYLFSDGFASQFGGLTGNEKLKYLRFREALLANHSHSMAQQKVLLNQYLKNWMLNASEQTDDIMVIGFKL